MRLLLITAAYPPNQVGGYELRCRDVVDGLRSRGHQIEVLTALATEQARQGWLDEPAIHRLLHLRAGPAFVLFQIPNDCNDLRFIDLKVREFNPDVVYLWDIHNLSNAILPYFSNLPIPLVYDEGGYGLIYLARMHRRGLYFYKNESDPIVKKWLKGAIYALARLVSRGLIRTEWSWPTNMQIYFNSQSAMGHSRQQGTPAKGARVLRSAIDVNRFPYRPRQRPVPPLQILVAGRIKPAKGTKDAVFLVRELKRRGIESKVRLVGKDESAEYREQIIQAIHEAELEGAVEFLPMASQADMACLYREADVCFFPTYFKTGFSRVPLEAMASGCLVMTYGNEGSSESVRSGETGYVVPEGNIQAAAGIIEGLIGDAALYRDMTRKARERVERDYSLPCYLDAVESLLLEQATSGSRPGNRGHA